MIYPLESAAYSFICRPNDELRIVVLYTWIAGEAYNVKLYRHLDVGILISGDPRPLRSQIGEFICMGTPSEASARDFAAPFLNTKP